MQVGDSGEDCEHDTVPTDVKLNVCLDNSSSYVYSTVYHVIYICIMMKKRNLKQTRPGPAADKMNSTWAPNSQRRQGATQLCSDAASEPRGIEQEDILLTICFS